MSFCINPNCPKPNDNSDNILFCLGCGSELLLQGRYKVVKYLGGGGFGKTYEIKERNATSKVLKILHNNFPKAIELFQREAEVLCQLNHHGIPQVEDDGYFIYHPRNSQEPLHCLVMEKIEGMDLYEYIKQREYRPIDERMAMQWLQELTIILQQVHNQNFFHRDIKPPNVMLRAEGGLALIDFGTARVVTDTYWQAQAQGKVTGIISAGYTPPEQMNGQAMQQSDFFALGRTFVYLLTAKDPNQFYNPQTDELLWRDAVSNISSQFADFLDWMMQRSPSQRPRNTEEILQRLSQIKPISSLPTLQTLQTATPGNFNQAVNSTVASPPQTTEADTPSISKSTVNVGFFYQWILSNVVGIGFGLFARTIFRGAVISIFGPYIGSRYAMLAAVVTWVPVEIMHYLVLRQRIKFDFWSLIEILFAFLTGLFLGTFIGRLLLGFNGQLIGSVIGVIATTSIAKWLTIRRQIEKTIWWFLVSLIGLIISVFIGIAVGLMIYFLFRYSWNFNAAFTIGYGIGVLTTTILSSLITGIALFRLFRRAKM
ncbi:serine/threonine protein kinase [Rivularia sp. PCC 7116]|uniref:protein kinase domain-containing protein n=1 Tax=Rivularia sp. PCC 7116 TaxID=373994 RepID=UPI00029F4522|nr:protein kinase [Rivularia sp. PCC 7116]AFY58987.1 serine/threonine protein kinase [Rivularia sp. PCC 7116]